MVIKILLNDYIYLKNIRFCLFYQKKLNSKHNKKLAADQYIVKLFIMNIELFYIRIRNMSSSDKVYADIFILSDFRVNR